MNFLPDAAYFLGMCVFWLVFGLAVSNSKTPLAEVLSVPVAAFLGLYGFFLWLAGSLGWFYPSLIFSFFILGAVVLCTRRAHLKTNFQRLISTVKTFQPLEKALLFYVFAVSALTFVLTLAPPSSADYDSLVYHLAVPARYLRDGKIGELAYDHHSYFPPALEMLFALGLEARGPVFAKLFHWLMLLLGALALAAIGRRVLSRPVGFLAAALYVSLPMAQGQATTAYIDLGFSAFAWLAILSFLRAQTSHNWRDFILCGLFCGFCLHSKYFGALVFGFLGIWLLGAQIRAKNLSARPILAFAIPALVVGLPVYLRNWHWTGNPVFPFAFGIFGGQGWTAEMAEKYDESQKIYGFGQSPLDFLLLPFRVATTPINEGSPLWPLGISAPNAPSIGFFDVKVLDILFQSFPGPAIFALGIPALFAPAKNAQLKFLSWFFAFLWVFWALTSQQIRYLFPALGLLCVIGAWGALHFSPRLPISRKVGAIFLILWLGFAPLVTIWRARGNFPVLSGAITPETYLSRAFAGYDAMQWISKNTDKRAEIAVWGEPRCFYLDRAYFWADDEHNSLLDYLKIQTPQQLATALKNTGATHVLWNFNAAQNGGFGGPPQPLWDQTVASGAAQTIFEANGYRVYELK